MLIPFRPPRGVAGVFFVENDFEQKADVFLSDICFYLSGLVS